MPFVNNNGIKIFYEVEGEGSPLLLHHGLSDSPKIWRTAGYIDLSQGGYNGTGHTGTAAELRCLAETVLTYP